MTTTPILRTATLCLISTIVSATQVIAATYALSNYTGDFKDRIVAAHGAASAGDTILIDQNFTVDRPFTVWKPGLIKGNSMAGGTNVYSQCVHVEDRAGNAYIKQNTMINEGNTGSDAVLVYSTDRFGHGTGALLTYQEKLAYAAGVQGSIA